MTLADRIALIANGKLIEQGSAKEVYETPKRRFTASFVGENNLVSGRVSARHAQSLEIDAAGEKITVPKLNEGVAEGTELTVSIRSELIQMSTSTTATAPGIAGTFVASVYLGLTTSHRVALADCSKLTAVRCRVHQFIHCQSHRIVAICSQDAVSGVTTDPWFSARAARYPNLLMGRTRKALRHTRHYGRARAA